MLLDDEAVALAFEPTSARLLGLGEIALAIVGFDVEQNLAGHSLPLPPSSRGFLLRRVAWCGFLCSRGLFGTALVFVSRLIVVAKAAFQRRHQVDHV